MEAQISDWEDEIEHLKAQLMREQDQSNLLRIQLEHGNQVSMSS